MWRSWRAGRFAARADRYDRDASFPAEDFADLFQAGLHAAGRTALARGSWAWVPTSASIPSG